MVLRHQSIEIDSKIIIFINPLNLFIYDLKWVKKKNKK